MTGIATTTEVYTILDATVTDIDSTTIQQYIDYSYNNIVQGLGTQYVETTDTAIFTTEVYDGSINYSSIGVNYLVVNHYPVVQVSTMSISDNDVTSTQFVVKADRIMIGTSATVSTFGTRLNGVRVGYKYGVVDPIGYGNVKQLNAYMAALDFMKTPKGRNFMMDNSRFAEINPNDVRPNDMVALYVADLNGKIESLKSTIGIAHIIF